MNFYRFGAKTMISSAYTRKQLVAAFCDSASQISPQIIDF